MTNRITIDVGMLDSADFDKSTGVVTVGPGIQLQPFAKACQAQGCVLGDGVVRTLLLRAIVIVSCCQSVCHLIHLRWLSPRVCCLFCITEYTLPGVGALLLHWVATSQAVAKATWHHP